MTGPRDFVGRHDEEQRGIVFARFIRRHLNGMESHARINDMRAAFDIAWEARRPVRASRKKAEARR